MLGRWLGLCVLLLAPGASAVDPWSDAKPTWAADQHPPSGFAQLRTVFQLSPNLTSASLYITAEASPLCEPPCLPHGGTSAPKLLGAYKAFMNDGENELAVGMGPGRNVNSTQGVDVIDVTSALKAGTNTILLQGYHTTRWRAMSQPKILAALRLTYSNGTSSSIVTDESWQAHPSPNSTTSTRLVSSLLLLLVLFAPGCCPALGLVLVCGSLQCVQNRLEILIMSTWHVQRAHWSGGFGPPPR